LNLNKSHQSLISKPFQALSDLVTEEDLKKGSLYPPLEDIQKCSIEIAEKVMQYAYDNNLATVRPKPENMREFIKHQMYDTEYKSAIPPVYKF
jgi:malate dehydrogenase (oxaloacetate-decarboxylating)(NADP+)